MFDVYQEVTARIIAELEAGIIPWQKPWFGSGNAIKRSNGEAYSLLNEMLLGGPGEYASFKQIHEDGGKVKKGAHGRMVVFWKMYRCQDKETQQEKVIPLLKYSTVFRIGEDTEGLDAKYYTQNGSTKPHAEPIAAAEEILSAYIERSGVTLESAPGDAAYYSPARDLICLPEMRQFRKSDEYYSTAFHEAVHSTGHKKRLNRFATGDAVHKGSTTYSKEELVAELGSATIMNALGLESAGTFRNSAAYIQSWLGALKNDKTLLVGASSRAQKAVALIMGHEGPDPIVDPMLSAL